MKNDIDFDELDRAVNSLMGGSAGTLKSADEIKPKTLSISPTLKPGEEPEYEKVDEVAKRIGNEALITDTDPTIVKNIGEISHADATQSTDSIAVTKGQSGDVQAEGASVSVAVSTPVAPAASRPAVGRFMDVVHPSSDMKSASTNQAAPLSAEAAPPQVAMEKQEAPISDVEIASPFLPDAKVEKRPLGEAVNSSFGDDLLQFDAPEEIVAINSEAIKRHGSDKNSQEVLDASKYNEESTVDKELRALEAIGDTQALNTQAEELQAVESVDAKLAVDGGAQSQVSSLSHPPKQKSGWGIVVIIVIIIVLAAAIGAGAYFLLGLAN